MRSHFILAAAAATVLSGFSVANAARLAVNFQELASANGVYTGPGAYTGDGQTASATWNPTQLPKGSLSVANGAFTSDGSAVPLASQIVFTSHQGDVADNRSITTSNVPADFLGQIAYYNGNFTLTNMPVGTYDLYLYSSVGVYSAPNSGLGTQFTVSSSQTPAESAITTDATDKSFILGNTYVVLPVTVGADGIVNGSWTSATSIGSGQSEFAGLQVVLPEPASLGLLAIGAVPLLARRRPNA